MFDMQSENDIHHYPFQSLLRNFCLHSNGLTCTIADFWGNLSVFCSPEVQLRSLAFKFGVNLIHAGANRRESLFSTRYVTSVYVNFQTTAFISQRLGTLCFDFRTSEWKLKILVSLRLYVRFNIFMECVFMSWKLHTW